MSSKEEIVREQYEKMFCTQKYDTSVNRKMNFEYFSPAMDQYAKQECIAFAEWLKISAWSYSPYLIEDPVWKLTGNFLLLNPTAENKNYSKEELYTIYLQQKDHTPHT